MPFSALVTVRGALALCGAAAILAVAPHARAQAPQPRQVVARLDRPDNDLFDLPHPDSRGADTIPAPPVEPPAPRFKSLDDSLSFLHARDVADHSGGFRIVVSLEDRHLWVLAGADTVYSAPAAVARGTTLDFDGRQWTFVMPRGIRTVRGKTTDPTWQPPDWLYAETAADYGFKLVALDKHPYQLKDGRLLTIENDQVGIVANNVFRPMPVGEHIVFDSTLFMPPLGTKNRIVKGELGKYALNLGDGFLIHGTPEQESVGQPATHGCVRLHDADIQWLYDHIGVGVKVYIY